MASARRVGPAILAALALLLALSAPAQAITFGAPFRISQIGPEGDAMRGVQNPNVAWGGASGGRFLVAYKADGLATDNDHEIFARLLDSTGALLTSDVRLSTTGSEGETTLQPYFPDVVYNPVSEDFFVVWDQMVSAARREIFVVRVPSSGGPPSAPLQISDEDVFTGTSASIAVDRTSGAMLVVWADSRHGTLKEETYGQRLDSAGAQVGSDIRVSNKHTPGPFNGRSFYPEAAWNEALSKWLVVWQYNGSGGLGGYFQMLDAFGAETGPPDAQFTGMGGEPAPASAGAAGWQVASDTGPSVVGTQRIDGAGALSAAGPTFAGANPAIGSDPAGGFLVVSNSSGVGALELGSDGAQVGDAATVGLSGPTVSADVAFDEVARRWLVVATSKPADADYEAYGAFSGPSVPVPPPPPPPVQPPAQPALPSPVTPAPVAAAPPRAPSFTQVVSLPSTKRCVSRRKFAIRLREPSGVDITRATVSVNGKRVKVVRRVVRRAIVNLRGLPKGRFTVKIVLTTKAGKNITGTRRYRTCVPKRGR